MTPADVAERLHEAIVVLAALPDRERRWLHVKAAWPETQRERADMLGIAYDRLQQGKSGYALPPLRIVPTPGQVDRMDEALQWLRWLTLRERQVVTLRAHGVSFLRIAWRFERDSDETSRRWHRLACEKIARQLQAAA